jgi:hypothetical protein
LPGGEQELLSEGDEKAERGKGEKDLIYEGKKIGCFIMTTLWHISGSDS